MLSKIVKLDQSFNISLGHVTNYIVMELQNGSVIRAQVTDAEYNHVLEAVSTMTDEATTENVHPQHLEQGEDYDPNAPENTKAPYSAESVQAEDSEDVHSEILFQASGSVDPPQAEDEEEEEEDMVSWRELPDTALSPLMKKILEDIALPDPVAYSTLEAVVAAVAEGKGPEGNGAPTPGVRITEGTRIVSKVPPIRSVDKDEMGYPRVPQATQAPSVAGGEDLDEDGVGQL